MKPITRILPILLLVACAASFSVEAQQKTGASKPGPTNPQDIKSPSKGPARKTIGDCNSAKGCKALKAACESKEVGGAFKPSNKEGTSGLCVKEAAKVPGNFTAPGNDTHDANCYTRALCGALRTKCKGTWKQDYPNSGIGKCID